jgi:hypothetical protein
MYLSRKVTSRFVMLCLLFGQEAREGDNVCIDLLSPGPLGCSVTIGRHCSKAGDVGS